VPDLCIKRREVKKKEKRTPSRLAAGDTKETKKIGQGRTKSRQQKKAGRFESILEPARAAGLPPTVPGLVSLWACAFWFFLAPMSKMDGLRPCVRSRKLARWAAEGSTGLPQLWGRVLCVLVARLGKSGRAGDAGLGLSSLDHGLLALPM
ncbi:hypothetical protein CI102_10409, partial [Trichoderma harzianum]